MRATGCFAGLDYNSSLKLPWSMPLSQNKITGPPPRRGLLPLVPPLFRQTFWMKLCQMALLKRTGLTELTPIKRVKQKRKQPNSWAKKQKISKRKRNPKTPNPLWEHLEHLEHPGPIIQYKYKYKNHIGRSLVDPPWTTYGPIITVNFPNESRIGSTLVMLVSAMLSFTTKTLAKTLPREWAFSSGKCSRI